MFSMATRAINLSSLMILCYMCVYITDHVIATGFIRSERDTAASAPGARIGESEPG